MPVFIVSADQLHQLILLVFVKAQAAAGMDDLAVFIFVPAEDQAAILGAPIVEENHAGAGALVRIFLASDDGARKPRPVRNHHAQRAVWLDQIDALDVEFLQACFFGAAMKPLSMLAAKTAVSMPL
jgi:hypothetical protein